MGSPSPPAPPDPRQTAAAQTSTNVNTAIANSTMGMVDQITPYGTLTYERIGSVDPSTVPQIETIQSDTASPITLGGGFNTRRGDFGNQASRPSSRYQVGDQSFGSFADAEAYRNTLLQGDGGVTLTDDYTGATYNVPRYRSTIELSPEQQEILNTNQQAQQSLSRLAADRSEFLEGYLPNTEALTDQISNQLYDMGRQRLDPRFAEQEDALRTRLANQGIAVGSEAYDREMRNFEQSRNDAYNDLTLSGRSQALTEINNPINQITGLLGNTQVTNPSVTMQSPSRIPTTDVAGIINNNYNQQMASWQQQNQNSQSLGGGLLGAAGMVGGALPWGSWF